MTAATRTDVPLWVMSSPCFTDATYLSLSEAFSQPPDQTGDLVTAAVIHMTSLSYGNVSIDPRVEFHLCDANGWGRTITHRGLPDHTRGAAAYAGLEIVSDAVFRKTSSDLIGRAQTSGSEFSFAVFDAGIVMVRNQRFRLLDVLLEADKALKPSHLDDCFDLVLDPQASHHKRIACLERMRNYVETSIQWVMDMSLRHAAGAVFAAHNIDIRTD